MGEIYTFVIVKLSHQSKTIVTMKGTIKKMIYCRARFEAMLRRRVAQQQSLETGFSLAFLCVL